MNGHLVDVVLVVLALLFAINGYRQGFVVGMLSFIGFFGGAVAGVQIAPLVAERFSGPAGRVVVSLTIVFALALLGQALAAVVGNRIRRSIRNQGLQVADDIGGAAVSVVAVLMVAWMVAAPLASSSVPWLAKAVRNSSIVGGVDKAMPGQARALYNSMRDAVDTDNFPNVFGALTPTQVRSVAPPDPALAGSAVVQRAHRSVVKILGDAPSCSRRIEGSGFVYAPQHVMTNAHVVAGTRTVQVEANGDRYRARVVVYDPKRDLAVLYVPDLDAPVLKWSPRPAASGDGAIVVGYPLDGPYRAVSARVRDLRQVRGPDIYETGTVVRQVYTIRSDVRSGNSGGPLLASDGTVYGVIFAAAADDPETGFALSQTETAPVAAEGRTATEAGGTGHCT